jgi:hypothetical protein
VYLAAFGMTVLFWRYPGGYRLRDIQTDMEDLSKEPEDSDNIIFILLAELWLGN